MNNEDIVENRYDFLLLFDVKDGNPNGDPDAGNLPRLDAETGDGLVTDVSIKRKIRNYVEVSKEGKSPYRIFIREKAVLNKTIEEAYTAKGVDVKALKKNEKPNQEQRNEARDFLCENYFDIRTFGAVMSTGLNAGQVRGPVQITFARSVVPIVSLEHSITRVAVATEKEAADQGGENRTMGRKSTVPYGLYRTFGFVSPSLASQTGFSNNDLELLFEALEKMFEIDRSAAHGLMSTRRLFVFKHSSKLGDAPSQDLFNSIKVSRIDENKAPRDFSDFTVTVDHDKIPKGVTLIERV